MRVEDFLQDLSWALYVLIFLLVAVRAARRPTRAHLDMTLFFGVVAVIIVLSAASQVLYATRPPPQLLALTSSLLLGLPHLLLRLVEDFTRVPKWVLRASAAGLVLSVLLIFLAPTPLPSGLALALMTYFVVVVVYDTWAFVRAAQRGRGVTRRRMQAVAAGSGCLALVLLLAAVGLVVPAWAEAVDILGRIGGLASG